MKRIAMILGCILYVLSPIDLIPDFIPVLGQCDDAAVVLLTIRALLRPNKTADDKDTSAIG